MFGDARNGLIGIARYFAWRQDAPSYFAGTRSAFVRSLVAYLLAFPFEMVGDYLDADVRDRQTIDVSGWAIYVGEFVITNACWLGIALAAASLFGRKEHFFRYATAANWYVFLTSLLTTAALGLHEATGVFEREDAVGMAADIVGLLLLFTLVYWAWALLHQALKLRWSQSLPLILVLIGVSLCLSVFAVVAVRVVSA